MWRFRCAHSKWRSTGCACSAAPTFQTGGAEPFGSPPECHTWRQSPVQFVSRLSARPHAAVNRTYRTDRPLLRRTIASRSLRAEFRGESVLPDRLRGGDGESADVLRARRKCATRARGSTSPVGDFPEESLEAGRASVRRQNTPEAPGSARGDEVGSPRFRRQVAAGVFYRPAEAGFRRGIAGRRRHAARIFRRKAEATVRAVSGCACRTGRAARGTPDPGRARRRRQ